MTRQTANVQLGRDNDILEVRESTFEKNLIVNLFHGDDRMLIRDTVLSALRVKAGHGADQVDILESTVRGRYSSITSPFVSIRRESFGAPTVSFANSFSTHCF